MRAPSPAAGRSPLLLASTAPASAQARTICGKVTDEGRPVAGAAIEVTSLSGCARRVRRRETAARRRSEVARHDKRKRRLRRRRATSGIYLVAASKDGVGTDQTEIAIAVRQHPLGEFEAGEGRSGARRRPCCEDYCLHESVRSRVRLRPRPAIQRSAACCAGSKLFNFTRAGCNDSPVAGSGPLVAGGSRDAARRSRQHLGVSAVDSREAARNQCRRQERASSR